MERDTIIINKTDMFARSGKIKFTSVILETRLRTPSCIRTHTGPWAAWKLLLPAWVVRGNSLRG